jgi:hypothetical protein
MSDRVQRWTSILVGGAVVCLVGWLTLRQLERGPGRSEADAGAGASVADASAATTTGASPASAAKPAIADEVDAGPLAFDLPSVFGSDAGSLPQGAPRTVRLGVVLVQYAGAEGASSSARGKKDALDHAQKLLADAKADFKKAVKDGDSGSSEDIGRVPRGVLDSRTEGVVFRLAPGEVSDVLETPRGYWIVKRIE